MMYRCIINIVRKGFLLYTDMGRIKAASIHKDESSLISFSVSTYLSFRRISKF